MKRILTLAQALALSSAALTVAAADRQPNIIVILADDLGYADIGVHGCEDIPTPNIDRIAARGVRFTDAYANGSFCTPTRAALLSGRYQHRCGQEDLSNVTGPLPRGICTFADRLREAGYDTGMVGKWHLGEKPGHAPVDRGFDFFFGFLGGGHVYLPASGRGEYQAPILRDREPTRETRYLTDAFGDEAVTFIARPRAADRPFFLYLALNAVHTPLEATARYLDRFPHIADARRRTYAGMLSAMDDAIGRVVAAVEEAGALERTLIMFTSDNGGPTTRNAVNGSRNSPLRGSKCETFEGGIRVPLVAQWPGVLPAGAVYRRPVMTFDITATALAAAGAGTRELDGVDLVPFVTGRREGSPHETLYWRCRTRSGNHAARHGDWKFVHSTEGGEQPGPQQKPARDMLFNLATDVGEHTDVSEKEPERLATLKRLYDAWSAEMDEDCRRLGIDPPGDTRPRRFVEPPR